MGEHECHMEKRIRDLETGLTETRIYIKQIKEDVQEIKTSVKELSNNSNTESSKAWQGVVIELIKLAGLCVTILGAIVGAVKILGK